ncbi:MAG: N-acyl homoserine lactonase family protein [Desulfovibrio sp.]|nr:MAG: N-acyl homoserine lactonase family protein [Desulfovibrio sp.]
MAFRITALLTGIRETDQGLMTYLKHYGRRIWLPMWSFLLQGQDKNILVDTGLDDFITPESFTKETGLTPMFMEDALESVGLKPEDIHMIIHTHLHDDHCGNNPLFPNAEVLVQRKELEFMDEPHPLDHRYEPSFLEGQLIRPLDGDQEILPGLSVLLTPGHTPGGQTVVVDTDKGRMVIPGFCCNCENFPQAGPAVCPGVHTNALAAYDSVQKVKGLEGTILPLHDLELAKLLVGG